MNCPNCGKEMKYKHENRKHIDFSGTADDYELEYVYEEHICSSCKIKFNSDWEIPANLQPTKKQIDCCHYISNNLSIDFEPLIKSKCSFFISEHINESMNKKHDKCNQEDDYGYEIYEEHF